MITVTLKDGKEVACADNITVRELAIAIVGEEAGSKITAANVDGDIKHSSYSLIKNCKVVFLESLFK